MSYAFTSYTGDDRLWKRGWEQGELGILVIGDEDHTLPPKIAAAARAEQLAEGENSQPKRSK